MIYNILSFSIIMDYIINYYNISVYSCQNVGFTFLWQHATYIVASSGTRPYTLLMSIPQTLPASAWTQLPQFVGKFLPHQKKTKWSAGIATVEMLLGYIPQESRVFSAKICLRYIALRTRFSCSSSLLLGALAHARKTLVKIRGLIIFAWSPWGQM